MVPEIRVDFGQVTFDRIYQVFFPLFREERLLAAYYWPTRIFSPR